VNEVTPGLFAKYPTPSDFAAVRPEVLANDIRSTGFFNNKAKSIVGAAQRVVNEFGGRVPKTIEEMLTIPGAARKTANVVLGTAYGIASGVVVDTHVSRISQRLDLTKNTDPVKDRQDLVKIIPRTWISFRIRSFWAGPLKWRAIRNVEMRSEFLMLRGGQAGVGCALAAYARDAGDKFRSSIGNRQRTTSMISSVSIGLTT
jgi:3-methyladenine DNA glycosylase/8-oxoguanine DNA glycosylase